MVRRTIYACLTIVAIVIALTTAARASDPLKIIPHDALGWGVIHHLSDGEAKMQKLAEIVGAPQISLLDVVKDKIGIKNGLDDKGALGMIVMPPKKNDDADTPPPYVVFVAITDYDAFLANFEPEKKGEKITEVKIADAKSVVAHMGDYAIFAKIDDRDTLEKVLSSKESIAAEVASLQTWLAVCDVNIVATKAGLKLLAAEGKQGLKKYGETIAAMGDQAKAMKPMLGMYASALEAAEVNVSLGAVGLHVDKPGNARITARLKMVSGTPLAATLADLKPGKGNLLAGLPGGGFIFAGGGVLQQSLLESLTSMSVTMMKSSPEIYGLTAEQAEKLTKISKQGFNTVRGGAMVWKTGAAGEPMYSNIYAVMMVDNADQFFANYGKQLKATQEILKDVKEGVLKPPVTKEIEFDGQKALELEMTMPVPPATGNPMQAKLMDLMFGPDRKITSYIVKGGEKTIYMSFGVTKEKLSEAIAQGKQESKGLQAEGIAATTVALLPPDSQAILLLSIRGYADMVQQMMSAMMGANGMMFQIPQFPKCPAIGFAVHAGPGEVAADVVLPGKMIKAVGEYVAMIRQRFMPQPPQIP